MTGGLRNEYKYLLDPCDTAVLKTRLKGLIPLDPHAAGDGRYLIRSLYFDDPFDSCYYEKEDGVDRRNKYRIRYYNNDPSRIALERKSKIHGLTQKTVCLLSADECRQLMEGNIPSYYGDDPKKKELLTELRTKSLRPKVIVSYERTAFVYPVGRVRITFDENLSSSSDVKSFLAVSKMERPIYPKGASLLEVKWSGVMPSFIKRAVSDDMLIWCSFSKYYEARRFNCRGGVRE